MYYTVTDLDDPEYVVTTRSPTVACKEMMFLKSIGLIPVVKVNSDDGQRNRRIDITNLKADARIEKVLDTYHGE